MTLDNPYPPDLSLPNPDAYHSRRFLTLPLHSRPQLGLAYLPTSTQKSPQRLCGACYSDQRERSAEGWFFLGGLIAVAAAMYHNGSEMARLFHMESKQDLSLVGTEELIGELSNRVRARGGSYLFVTKMNDDPNNYQFRLHYGPTPVEAFGLIECSRFQLHVKLAEFNMGDDDGS